MFSTVRRAGGLGRGAVIREVACAVRNPLRIDFLNLADAFFECQGLSRFHDTAIHCGFTTIASTRS